jgi:hypothetical protein
VLPILRDFEGNLECVLSIWDCSTRDAFVVGADVVGWAIAARAEGIGRGFIAVEMVLSFSILMDGGCESDTNDVRDGVCYLVAAINRNAKSVQFQLHRAAELGFMLYIKRTFTR